MTQFCRGLVIISFFPKRFLVTIRYYGMFQMRNPQACRPSRAQGLFKDLLDENLPARD